VDVATNGEDAVRLGAREIMTSWSWIYVYLTWMGSK